MVKCENPDCECVEKCDDCTCDDAPELDNFFDGQKMAEMMVDASMGGGHLSYCYSNERAPKLWMKKVLKELKAVSVSLQGNNHICARDLNKYLKVYVTNTVAMSQDVIEGMFSILEFADLQKQMLEATISFAKNHMMEVVKFDDDFEWEDKLLIIDLISGNDFEKSSSIMSRKKQFK
jgi:hypothetical protein